MIDGAALRGAARAVSPPVMPVAVMPGFPVVLAFENITPRFREIHRIQRPPVDEHLVAVLLAVAAEKVELLPTVNGVADLAVAPRKMTVAGMYAEAVVDPDHVPIADPLTSLHHDSR